MSYAELFTRFTCTKCTGKIELDGDHSPSLPAGWTRIRVDSPVDGILVGGVLCDHCTTRVLAVCGRDSMGMIKQGASNG